VIFKTQDDAPTIRARDAPHVHRVHQMPEMQIPGGCRCEAGAPPGSR
jgi:hypothetical protein